MVKPVLLIDDLRDFRTPPAELIICRNSREALHELTSNKNYEAIYLDHDLGMVDGQLDTINPVVDYLCEQSFNGNKIKTDIIYVHTSNPVGSVQMYLTLSKYGYNVARLSASKIFTV